MTVLCLSACAASAIPAPPSGVAFAWNLSLETAGVHLQAVATARECDPLAVGFTSSGSYAAVSERWDGTAWSSSKAPFDGSDPGLVAVSPITTDDAWAVGPSDGEGRGTIEQWDGSVWLLRTPLVATTAQSALSLSGIAAWADDDVWVVGTEHDLADPSEISGVAAHWNGVAWQMSQLPSGVSSLASVTGSIPSDMWAAGEGVAGSLVLVHWDGHSWTSALTIPGTGQIAGVIALSSANVWIAGDAAVAGPAVRPFLRHWNGTVWSTPSTTGVTGLVTGLAGDSSADLWLIGRSEPSSQAPRPFVLHGDGNAWTAISLPESVDELTSIVECSNRSLFALGSTGNPAIGLLLEHP